jgi:hypothetical protein
MIGRAAAGTRLQPISNFRLSPAMEPPYNTRTLALLSVTPPHHAETYTRLVTLVSKSPWRPSMAPKARAQVQKEDSTIWATRSGGGSFG